MSEKMIHCLHAILYEDKKGVYCIFYLVYVQYDLMNQLKMLLKQNKKETHTHTHTEANLI